jgi:hypothetical protein
MLNTEVPFCTDTQYASLLTLLSSTAFAGFSIIADNTDYGILFTDLVDCIPQFGFARVFDDSELNVNLTVFSQNEN